MNPDNKKGIVSSPLRASTYCRICGRLLTDPESVKKEIGPVCEKLLQIKQKNDEIWKKCSQAQELPPKPEYDLCNAGHTLQPFFNTHLNRWTWDCPICIERMRAAEEAGF